MKIDFQSLQKALESNIFLYCVVLLLILKIFSVGLISNVPFNIYFADITKSTLERLANQTRTSLGLAPLKPSTTLDKAAELKAEDMVKNQYFAHTSPQGATPWVWFKNAGYNYKYAGENLAIGFFDSIEVYNAWLNSPSHKQNLLNPNYKEIGTAVLPGFGNNNTIVVVQLFGSVQPTKATPIKNTQPTKPVTKPEQVTTTQNTTPKVLSQTTEAQFQQADNATTTSTYAKILNSLAYNYAKILQDVIFGFTMVFIGIMLTLIMFSFSLKLDRKLVFRSLIITAILFASLLIDNRIITALIPQQIII